MTIKALLLSAAILMAPSWGPAEAVGKFEVYAWVSTAGPYGEIWELTLKSSDSVSIEVSYVGKAMGKITGEFIPMPKALDDLRKAIEVERFAELPKALHPKDIGFHRPDLRLTIVIDGRKHEASLYDPDELKGDARSRRFLAVWHSAFALVPLSPKW